MMTQYVVVVVVVVIVVVVAVVVCLFPAQLYKHYKNQCMMYNNK